MTTLLGYPFFENFVVSYDYSNGAVDFGLNTLAWTGAAITNLAPTPTPSPTPTPGPGPTPTPTPDDPTKHSGD